MAWIIASVPFWIIGLTFLFVAVWGVYLCLRDDEDFKTTFIGGLVWLVLAGVVLTLAARISGL